LEETVKRYVPIAARTLLGLIFFAAGAAGLLNMLPQPTDIPAKLKAFMDGIMATEYFFPFLKGTETVLGFLLLTGFFPAIALVILAPITVNIFLVHMFLTPGLENLMIPGVIALLHVAAASAYWTTYRPLFKVR
jgi:uncharacterized membrane protein YphA (DoxX/SURF4 family)